MSATDSTRTIRTTRGAPNVYTALMLIAAIGLAICVGQLWYANTQLTEEVSGGGNPFHIVQPGDLR